MMRRQFGICLASRGCGKFPLAGLAVVLATLAASRPACAGPFVGTTGLGFSGVNSITYISGSPLDLSNVATITVPTPFATGATADLSNINNGSGMVPFTSSFTFSTASPSLTFTITDFGTFTSSSSTLVSQTATSLNYYLLGTFTAAAPDATNGYSQAFAPSSASVTIGFTQVVANTPPSFSGTFADPPAANPTAVPEPPAVALAGLGGLLGIAGFLVRRRRVLMA